MPLGMWQVRLCGMAVGTNIVQYLWKGISGASTFQYWVDAKEKIATNEVQNIDWSAQGKAMNMCGFVRKMGR